MRPPLYALNEVAADRLRELLFDHEGRPAESISLNRDGAKVLIVRCGEQVASTPRAIHLATIRTPEELSTSSVSGNESVYLVSLSDVPPRADEEYLALRAGTYAGRPLYRCHVEPLTAPTTTIDVVTEVCPIWEEVTESVPSGGGGTSGTGPVLSAPSASASAGSSSITVTITDAGTSSEKDSYTLRYGTSPLLPSGWSTTITGITTSTYTITGISGTQYIQVWAVKDGTQGNASSVVSAAPLTTYLLDTFTGSSGVALTSHTPDTGGSGGYVFGGSNFQLNGSGQAIPVTTVGRLAAGVDCGHADGLFKADLTSVANSVPGLMFRATDANNYLVVYIATNFWALQKMEAGAISQVGTAQGTGITNNVTYNIAVRCTGSTIQVYIDGALVATQTVTFNQTATKIGLADYRDSSGTYNGQGRHDNLSVTA